MTTDKKHIYQLLARWERAETTEQEEAWLSEQLRTICPLPAEWQPYAELMAGLDAGAARFTEAELDAFETKTAAIDAETEAGGTLKVKHTRRSLRYIGYAAAVLTALLFLLPLNKADRNTAVVSPAPTQAEQPHASTQPAAVPTVQPLAKAEPKPNGADAQQQAATTALAQGTARPQHVTAAATTTPVAASKTTTQAEALYLRKAEIDAATDAQLAAIEAHSDYTNAQNRETLSLTQR